MTFFLYYTFEEMKEEDTLSRFHSTLANSMKIILNENNDIFTKVRLFNILRL